jgi:hypothetical protein
MAIKSLARSTIRQSQRNNSALAGYESNYFHHLETVRLGGNASSVEFTNLARYNDFQHFQVRIIARASRPSAGNSPLFIQFNSSGGTAYASHGLNGSGAPVASEAIVSAAQMERAGNIAGSTAGTNVFGANIIDILDPFDTTKNTTVRVLAGGAYAANPIIGLFSGFWNNTAAVTTITFSDFAGTSFQAGSRFSLYGLKARA